MSHAPMVGSRRRRASGGWVRERELLPIRGKGMEAGREGTGGTGEGARCGGLGQEGGVGVPGRRRSLRRRRGAGTESLPLLGRALPRWWGNDPRGNGPSVPAPLSSVGVGQSWGERCTRSLGGTGDLLRRKGLTRTQAPCPGTWWGKVAG